jgi:hypothetical protein
VRKVSLIVVILVSLGALVVTSYGPERNIPSHPTASDVRHVEISGARVRISQGEGYIDGGVMPRFSTVRVLRTSSDSKFIVAETGDGRTITIAASALATGDGAQAKARWCDQQVQSPQLADRVKVARTRLLSKILEGMMQSRNFAVWMVGWLCRYSWLNTPVPKSAIFLMAVSVLSSQPAANGIANVIPLDME